MSNLHDLFISYAREDTDTMLNVKKFLLGLGLSVWTDEGISPGTESWAKAIEKALQEVKGVVVLFSPDAKESNWVGEELGFARMHKKQIFPLLVRGDESLSIPFGFSMYQWLDIRESKELGEELKKLTSEFKALGWIESPEQKASESITSNADETLLIKKSILWVDDNPLNNLWSIKAFKKLGASIITVESTRTALAMLNSDKFDLVISDVVRVEEGRKNDNAGYDLWAVMKEREDLTPLVFYTGSVRRLDKNRSDGIFGAADWIDTLNELVFKALKVSI